MKGAKQTTLRGPVAISGIGVHSGQPVTLTLNPGDDDTGILFQRINTDGSLEREIRADVRAVTATEFATVLGDAKGPLCSTAEHLLAALRGLNVDNVVIEVDGPEVPIMDGSADAFVTAIDQAGIVTLDEPRQYIKVLKPVRVLRNNVVIFEGELDSLRRFSENVDEVKSGTECGIGVKGYDQVKPGDQIECFERVEIQRTL